MTDDDYRIDAETAIDRRVDAALPSATDASVSLARAAVEATPDRWYGRLLLASHDAAADEDDTATVVPAAAAIELLRGYYRVRGELLGAIGADDDRSSAREDPTEPLLAGDVLFSLAYSTLAEVDHSATDACFATLVRTSRTIVESFAAIDGERPPSPAARRDLLDGTAGALGRGAAVLGATLAGVEGDRREAFATLGRGLGVARVERRAMDEDGDPLPLGTDAADDVRARHVDRPLAEAERARRDLAATVGAHSIRPVFDAVASGDE